MRFRWFCLTLCAGQFGGCENPRPTLTQVEPRQAYSDHDVGLTLVGDGFLPATTLDPATGSRVVVIDAFRVRMGKGTSWAELTNLTWQSTSQLTATLSSASAGSLPSGWLAVEITDPRGQQTTKDDGFDELGPDLTPPVVTFTSPPLSTPVGPGTSLRVNIHASASDAPLGIVTELHWTYSESNQPLTSGECSTGAAEVDCPFQIKVSPTLQGGEPIEFVATALDDSNAQTLGSATLPFTVLAQPTVQSIWPISGGTMGGTDIVRTPIGDAQGIVVFSYLPAPLVETITPNTGAFAGGTAVVLTGKDFTANTQIYFGSTLGSAVPLSQLLLQSDNTIVGRTPAGRGQTTVWAWDEALGFTRLPNGFTWGTP